MDDYFSNVLPQANNNEKNRKIDSNSVSLKSKSRSFAKTNRPFRSSEEIGAIEEAGEGASELSAAMTALVANS